MEKKNNYLPKVKNLRAKVCIGLQDGIELLKTTDGDVEKASSIFKERILNLTLSVIKLPADQVTPYLEKYKYDAGRVIDTMMDKYHLIDGVPQPEPLYILHKFRDSPKDAVSKIAGLIIKKERLSRKWQEHSYEFPWLKAEELSALNPQALCVVALSEWLDYEDSESFEDALFYNSDLVFLQIQALHMPELAAALRMARDIFKELIEAYGSVSEGFYTALRKDEDFRAAKNYFVSSRPLLIDTIYRFIASHLDKLNL